MHAQQKLDPNGKPISTPGTPRATMQLDSPSADPANHVLSDWMSVFGAMYGGEVRVAASDSSLVTIIGSAATILDIVDYLALRPAAVGTVLAPLELALLAAEQMLWRSVAGAPLEWVGLATRLRSVPVFREAALHVIGGWNEWTAEEKEGLGPRVRGMCEAKARKFEGFKKGLEEEILAYRHAKLQYDQKADDPRGKKLHEPDVLIWQAQFFLCNWLARCFWEGMGHKAPDGGFELYKMLGEGGDAYCSRADQAMVSALTHTGRKVVAEHMKEMKEDLRKMVEPVLISNLRLDQSKTPTNRLTPFTIELRHCPWSNGDGDERGAGHKAHRTRERACLQKVADEEDDLEDFIP